MQFVPIEHFFPAKKYSPVERESKVFSRVNPTQLSMQNVDTLSQNLKLKARDKKAKTLKQRMLSRLQCTINYNTKE